MKKFLLLTSAIVIGVSIFIGWQVWKMPSVSPPGQVLPSPPPTITAPPNTSEPRTYRNEEFGFEFQHPQAWSFVINSFSNPYSRFNLMGNSSSSDFNPFNPDFLINIVTPDFVENQFSDLSETSIVVGGVSGKKYEYVEETILHRSIILPLRDYQMIIATDRRHESVFNQILTTFKFLK